MQEKSCPMSGIGVLDEHFLDNRARILDIAAFLDRIDRSQDPKAARTDPRHTALLEALEILTRPGEERARAVQLCFSDPTTEPLESAAGLKGALGAWMGGE